MSSLIQPDRPGTGTEASPRRLALERCLTDAAQLAGIDAHTCDELFQKLQDMAFHLVVAGQFKRGKSSVLNALLGEPLLPVGVIPLTSIVTVIRSGTTASARAQLQNGREERIPLDSLQKYVTERGNPRNILGVRQVVVEHPSPWLAQGVRLVDTPGIGSVYEHNTDVAQQYLPNADAVLFIASVDQPLARAELDFLLGIRQYAERIFCVLNKIDHLSPQELNDSIAFVREQLQESIGVPVPLFAVSARMALEARRRGDLTALAQSGFPRFEEALLRFVSQDKEEAVVGSVRRSLLRMLSQARFARELEATLLTAPQAQLDANLSAFRSKRLEVERASADHQVLLESDARMLFDNQVVPELEEFKHSQQRRIGSSVQQWYEELAALPAGKLSRAIEERLFADVRASYDAWLAREDVSLTGAFRALCERAWASLQSAVDELIRQSSEILAVSFEPVIAESHWSMDSRFYYKFWYEPTSLRIISGSAVLMLPKWAAKGLVIRRVSAQAVELVEIQAGRIRHDLQERLKDSVREVNRRLAATADSILSHIETALRNGTRIREQGTSELEARSVELRAMIDGITTLERRVRADGA